MLSRYVSLGLLCIFFFLGCQTVVKESETVKPFISETKDKDSEISLDEQIEKLVKEYMDDIPTLIPLIEDLVEGKETEYTELLARLDFLNRDFKRAIERVLSNSEYENNEKLLEIVVNSKKYLQLNYLEDLNKILKINPDSTFALNLYAQLLIQRMELNKAQELLVKSHSVNNNLNETYILLGDLMLARVDEMGLQNKRVLSSNEESEINSYYKQAIKYYNRGNNGTNPVTYVKLSQVHKNLGEKLEAIKALNRAIELNPNDPWNYYDRGKLYFYMVSYEKAEEDFLKAIELDPDHFFSNVFLGRIYFNLNNSKESFKYYTKVLNMNNEYYPAYRDYGVLLYTRGEISEGIKYLVKLYNRKERSYPFLPLLLVSFFIDDGNMTQAKNILTNLVKYEKKGTMKDIYQYLLDPIHTGDEVLTDILNLENRDLKGRYSYYVALAMEKEGIYSLSRSILQEVLDTGVVVESKLAKYKLGELNE